jgi:hypothetical protein
MSGCASPEIVSMYSLQAILAADARDAEEMDRITYQACGCPGTAMAAISYLAGLVADAWDRMEACGLDPWRPDIMAYLANLIDIVGAAHDG